MPIIKSISGIRGTIGEKKGEDLTTKDIGSFSAAFAMFLVKKNNNNTKKIVIGRDARISGEKIEKIILDILVKLGFEVINLGLATTPTVEMAVILEKAQGGIIITASHNPKEWNALKMINEKGEFMSSDDMKEILKISETSKSKEMKEMEGGKSIENKEYLKKHINKILELGLVDLESIKKRNFKIVVDGINSVGGVAIPELLKRLGLNNIIEINCFPDGEFAHNPEPLEKNLGEIMKKVKEEGADIGIVVDPDVDRLTFIDDNGEMFGEENTLVVIADYILENYVDDQKYKKNTVSNLSSSRALKDITNKNGGEYFASAVGEINVVEKMKEVKAVIGGEGNGGVIYPELHYGRDALVGVALFLTYLVKREIRLSELKKEIPKYYMIKDKIEITKDINLGKIFSFLKKEYREEQFSDIDGLKIDYRDSWVHLRASNTEPIIRLYGEAKKKEELEQKIKEIKDKIIANIS